MVKLNKIYTKTGDSGDSGLVGGGRTSKASARMNAIGSVDEANSLIGVVRLHTHVQLNYDAMLNRIQHDLFDLGADLATPITPEETAGQALRVVEVQVTRLEQEIDEMNASLAPLTSFVLPGGTIAAANLYLARAVVRRAERNICALAQSELVGRFAVPYVNRLSDHLFVMARAINGTDKEIMWQPGVNR